jgi:putative FmdB family regulatory protein
VPTYSYACTSCEHRFDVQQSFSDAALTDCPECAGRLRKVFSPVGVVFKGSGFYRNDSRNGGTAKKAGGDGSADVSGGGSAGDGTSAGGTAGGSGGSTAGGGTARGGTTGAPTPAASSAGSGSTTSTSTPAPAA